MTRPDITPVRPDEPAVTSPALAELVDAARAVPVRPVSVDAATIHGAWRDRRDRRRRGMAVGGLLAAAAVAVMFVGLRPGEAPTEPATAAVDRPAPAPTVAPEATASEPPPAPEPSPAPALADDVRVAAHDGSPEPAVLGPREVRLETGRYEVTVLETATAPALIRTPDGTIELERGVLIVVLSGPAAPQVTLEQGAAAWVDGGGGRRPIGEADAGARPAPKPTARSLARRAEALQRAGDRAGAIDVLTRLVERHPRAAASRSALLDLARLLRQDGRNDAARCAYGLYLERWPHSRLRGEVERALRKLGDGPTCNGLRPAR